MKPLLSRRSWLFLLLSAGCAQLPIHHRTGSHPKYQSPSYLSASGFSDQSVADAAVQARLAIVAQVNSKIQSVCTEIVRSSTRNQSERIQSRMTCRTYSESSFPYTDLIRPVSELAEKRSEGWYQFFVLNNQQVRQRIAFDIAQEQLQFAKLVQGLERSRTSKLWLQAQVKLRALRRLAAQMQLFGGSEKTSLKHQDALKKLSKISVKIGFARSVSIEIDEPVTHAILEAMIPKLGLSIGKSNTDVVVRLVDAEEAYGCELRRKMCCYCAPVINLCSGEDSTICIDVALPREGDCHAVSKDSAQRKVIKRYTQSSVALDALEQGLSNLVYIRSRE